MIKKFSIEGFKTFKSKIEISLDPMTVIIGNNNAGKSTLLHALTFFQHCIDATWCSTDKTLKAGSIIGQEIQGVLPVSKLEQLWPDADTSNPIYLRGDFDSASIELSVSLNASRFHIEPNICGTLPADFEYQNIRFIPVFSNFSPNERRFSASERKDHLRNNRHGQVVRNLLVELQEDKDQHRWNLLLKVISEMFPGTDLSIGRTSPNIEVVHSQTGRSDLDLLAAGAGFHQGLQIFASTIAGGPGTVLLDEPDAHLHAQRQERLMEVLRGLTETETDLQFVIASHSPHIVHSAPRESLRLLDDGKVIGFDSNTRTLFDEIGVTDRMLYLPLIENQVILFVENRSDETFLKCFADKYWGKDEALRVWEEITVLHSNGAPHEKDVITTAKHLGTVLNNIRKGQVTVFAVSDRDHRSGKEREQAMEETSSSAINYTFILYMWKAIEIENYLMDVNAISKVLETTRPDKWGKKLQSEFSKQFKELVEMHENSFSEQVFTRASEFANRKAKDAKKDGLDEFLKHQAVQEALGDMQNEWKNSPEMFCDAKKVLEDVKKWCNCKRLGLGNSIEEKIISNMCDVPDDVKYLLDELKNATEVV